MVAALPHWITRCPWYLWNLPVFTEMAKDILEWPQKLPLLWRDYLGWKKPRRTKKLALRLNCFPIGPCIALGSPSNTLWRIFSAKGVPPPLGGSFLFAKMCTGSWVVNFNHTFIFWGPFCWNLSWANGVRCINISPIQNPAQICRHIGGLHPQLYRYPWKRCGPRWFTRGRGISINT